MAVTGRPEPAAGDAAPPRPCALALLGLARDCARTLPNLFGLINDLNAAGLRTAAIVGENGSRDDSRAQLARYAGSGRLQLVATDELAAEPDRLARMALGRERLLKTLREGPMRPQCVAVIDLDDPLARPPRTDSLIAAVARLGTDRSHFARAATSSPTYYDLLAFEDARVSYAGVDFHARGLRRSPLAYYRFYRDFVYPAQAAATFRTPHECRSAFNGLCLYRYEDYVAGSYVAGNDFLVSEHVAFNRGLAERTGTPMLIDPTLVVEMPAEHGRRGPIGFWLQRAGKLVRAGRSGAPRGALTRS